MPEFKKITTKEQLQEALKRNKRFGLKQKETIEQRQKDEFTEFLKWYVFDKKNTTPSELVGNIQTQYYAEQNFRERRQRNVDFTRGRQFNELVWDSEIKQWTTQLQYLRRRNIPPLTYNVISKFMRSLTGQFRDINTGNVVKCESRDERGAELANLLTMCLDKILSKNKAKSQDAANFKELLLSGRPICKVMWSNSFSNNNVDVKIRIVSSPKFVENPGVVDYDLDNFHAATEIHDTDLDSIVEAFANGDYERGIRIRNMYIRYQGDEKLKSSYNFQSFDGMQLRNMAFHYNSNSSYRYFEHWCSVGDYEAMTKDPLDGTGQWQAYKWQDASKIKEAVDIENEARKANAEGVDPSVNYLIQFKATFVKRFYVIFLAPWGEVLDVRESPYKCGKIPYVFPSPDINGEMWGLIEELINPQLSLDRQIANADAIVANASKGVWLIPDTALPDEYTRKEYLTELKKSDGAVFYKVRDGAEDIIPKQVFANSANVASNVQTLIQMYSNLVDEISGNYGAAQGRDTNNKTASGYALETQNAGLNVRDVMENYLTMLVGRDELILKFILEGYTREDYERITGISIDPKELTHYDFVIEQSKGTNSPAYRMQQEQDLLQLVLDQLLPFDVFMDVSTNPVMLQAKQKYEEWKKKQQNILAQQAVLGQQSTPENQPANV